MTKYIISQYQEIQLVLQHIHEDLAPKMQTACVYALASTIEHKFPMLKHYPIEINADYVTNEDGDVNFVANLVSINHPEITANITKFIVDKYGFTNITTFNIDDAVSILDIFITDLRDALSTHENGGDYIVRKSDIPFSLQGTDRPESMAFPIHHKPDERVEFDSVQTLCAVMLQHISPDINKFEVSWNEKDLIVVYPLCDQSELIYEQYDPTTQFEMDMRADREIGTEYLFELSEKLRELSSSEFDAVMALYKCEHHIY